MRSIISLLIATIFFCCNSKSSGHEIAKEEDTNQKNIEVGKLPLIFVEDTLTNVEKKFLGQIIRENEFLLLSNQVYRYSFTGDSSLVVNKLVFSKELLQEKGYVFFEIYFYGSITQPNVHYNYSLGQASSGFGSVVGNETTDYLHTLRSCGITACIAKVYQNGEKIFEKTN